MLDSPFDWCKVCRGYVLLDQTHRECVREHGCEDRTECPLRQLFTGIDFAPKQEPARAGARRGRG